MTSTFDAALGTDAASFTKAIGELYKKPGAREKFFKGKFSEDGKDVGWDAQTAPTFEFTAPSADHWQSSFDSSGKPPSGQPPADVVQLKVATLKVTHGSLDVSTTVETFLRPEIKDKKLTLTPLSIWYDPQKFTKGDKFFIKVIIKALFPKAVALLAGIKVPALGGKLGDLDLSLTVQSALVTGNHLVVLATAPGTTPAQAPKDWPTQPLFVLVSPSLRDLLVRKAVEKVKAEGTGKWSGDGATAEWKITSITNIKPAGQNTSKITADLDGTFTASYSAAGSKCAVSKAVGKS